MYRWCFVLVIVWPTLATAHVLRCRQPELTVPHRYVRVFDAAGRRFKVDPDLGRAITLVESNFNPHAVSPKGAVGLMQLMPDIISQFRIHNPFNPIQSIYGGMAYLHWLADSSRFAGDPYMVLVAYNAGPNRTVFPKASYQYANVITSIYWQLKDRQRGRGPSHVLAAPACYSARHYPPSPRWRDGKLLPSRRDYKLLRIIAR